jgi:phosphoribosyl 1,2-cyclic phosphodiesterase
LLIDAGFSCRQIEQRMAAAGIDPKTLTAILLTHEHSDHAKGVDLVSRRYGLPIYLTAGTLESVSLSDAARSAAVVLASGRPVEVAGFEIESFGLPHDAREPVGFLVEDRYGRRLGLAADLGCRTQLAWGRLHDLDLLILETNHDLDMLRTGPYPWALKQRVAGRHGHLSNREAADGLPELLGDRLRWIALYHLSRTNNAPELAAQVVQEVLTRERCEAQIAVCAQHQPTAWLEVL